MSLKIGTVGLPNVGKSTLFRALTKKQVDIANYPFVTIEPNVGIVEVPDERVEKLAELSKSRKKIHAVVEFVDIAGLVKGAAAGEGLGNKFLSHIKEVDAIAEVVRIFDDPDILRYQNRVKPVRSPAVSNSKHKSEGEADLRLNPSLNNTTSLTSNGVNPEEDIKIVELELILKDLETVTKRLESIDKQIRGGDKSAPLQKELLLKIKTGLEKEETALDVLLREPEEFLNKKEITILLNELSLLTAKPRIFVFNGSEKQITEKWEPNESLNNLIKLGAARTFADSRESFPEQKIYAPWILLCATTEDELSSLVAEEKKEYLKTLGLQESGLDRLIKTAYKTLNLITFLTTGEDETRAWTIPFGSSAPRAGRAIHSDFEEKFIRAEVIPYEKLIKAGTYARARELGWLKTEGKEYIVKDGDVIEFKI